MKIIDVSGFGHSGKTAVSDLLREVNGVGAHDHSFEFGLIRYADGILDLQSNLVDNWSPIRSDRAIKRFRELCQKLASGYSKHLNPFFLEISDKYIESLIDGRLFINGWFDPLYDQQKLDINREILKKFGLLEISKVFAKILRNKKVYEAKKTEVFISSGSDFILKTKKYLEKLNNYVNLVWVGPHIESHVNFTHINSFNDGFYIDKNNINLFNKMENLLINFLNTKEIKIKFLPFSQLYLINKDFLFFN